MAREAIKTYTPEDAERLNAELGQKSAEEIVRWAGETFGPAIKFANSFGAEDVALQDIIAKNAPQIRVFTLDTGRLNDETYEVMENVRFKYSDIPIEVMFPDRQKVESLVRERGFYSFRESVDNRRSHGRSRSPSRARARRASTPSVRASTIAALTEGVEA